jgi:predicted HTH domain antitoxin
MSTTTEDLQIPREVLDSARLTPAEARAELAIALYAQGRLSVGKAAELARMSLWQFRQVLAGRQIESHYGPDDLGDEQQALRETGLA